MLKRDAEEMEWMCKRSTKRKRRCKDCDITAADSGQVQGWMQLSVLASIGDLSCLTFLLLLYPTRLNCVKVPKQDKAFKIQLVAASNISAAHATRPRQKYKNHIMCRS